MARPWQDSIGPLSRGITALADAKAYETARADQLEADLDLAIKALREVVTCSSLIWPAKQGQALFVLTEIETRRNRRTRVEAA